MVLDGKNFSNSARSVFLATMCAFGLSCSSHADSAHDALGVISLGCGAVLPNNSNVVFEKFPDGSEKYFGEKRDDDSYQKCEVVTVPSGNSMKIRYYTESIGEGVSDSCVLTHQNVACNGAESVDDQEVVAFGLSVAGCIKYWLSSPRPAATPAATTTDMSSVSSGAGL